MELHGWALGANGAPAPPADPGTVLGELLVACGVTGADMVTSTQMRATMWRSEAARHGFPAIILDNARNADQVRALLPSNGGCGQLAQSRELLEQAVPLHRTIGDRMGEADGLRSLGQTHADSGDRHAAHASWEQAALIYQDI